MARGKKLSPEMVTKMLAYYKECKSARKTAKEFGIGKSTVLDYTKPTEVKKKREKIMSEKNVIRVRNRRRKLKEMAIEYKGGCCQECGYDKAKTALEFHHLDPNKKDFGIAAKGHTRSWEKIKIELDKCIMVCSNCHREIHEGLIEVQSDVAEQV